jgi:predicted Abi (CAAX) family protease
LNYLRLRLYITLRISAHRIWMAVKTRPRWSDWGLAALLLLAFSLIVLPLGLESHWLTPGIALPWPQGLRLAARVLVLPALTEEVFWRVLMLPHKTEILTPKKRWLVGLPMLGLFVLMHVFSSLTIYPQGFPTFVDPIFLLSATLLGLICTVAYWAGCPWLCIG